MLISLPVSLLKIQLAYKLQHRIFTKQPSVKTNTRQSLKMSALTSIRILLLLEEIHLKNRNNDTYSHL